MPLYLQYSRQTFLHSQIPISNLFFFGLFCHALLKRDQGDEVWRFRLNVTPHVTGCEPTHDFLKKKNRFTCNSEYKYDSE